MIKYIYQIKDELEENDMKKGVLLKVIAFVALMLINPSVSHAGQIRFADVGAENFVAQLKQTLYSDDFRQFLKNDSTFATVIYPVLTDVVRDSSLDNLSKRLTAWRCYYGREDSMKEDGQIVFYIDSSGYVFEIIMIHRREPLAAQVGALVLTAFFPSINLTSDECSTLMKNGNVWSSYNNRLYINYLSGDLS